MSNKYLEKIALNAQKARAMAKSVGVIPDTDSAWKFAVRRLRDRTGSPLTGKALSAGKVRLGDVSNNSFLKIKSIDRKLVPGTEISVSSKNGVLKKDSVSVGKLRGESADGSGNIHTHPYPRESTLINTSKAPEISYRKNTPHRIASPSGVVQHRNYSELMSNNFGNKPSIAEKHLKNLRVTDFKQGGHLQKTDLGRARDKLTETLSSEGGDISHWASRGDKNLNTIVAPKVNTTSSTKISMKEDKNSYDMLRKVRTIYFDHTPKKSKITP